MYITLYPLFSSHKTCEPVPQLKSRIELIFSGFKIDPTTVFRAILSLIASKNSDNLEYSKVDINDCEGRLGKIFRRGIHRTLVLDFGSLPDLMAEGLTQRMVIEHMDTEGMVVFSSRAWPRLFDIRGPLVREYILEFFSTFRFWELVLELDIAGTL